MERLSTVALLAACLLAGGVLAGCSSEASVTKEEEDAYKHPKPPDLSKIPPEILYGKGGPPPQVTAPKGTDAGGVTPPPTGTQ